MENESVTMSFGEYIKQKLKNKFVILFLICYGTIGIMTFFAWSERFFDPVRGWMGTVFGENFAMGVARETDDYFRHVGSRIDWLMEDIEAVAIHSAQIDTYKITVTETLADPRQGFLNPGFFLVEQHIIFERRGDIIKVQVIPQETVLADRALFYESLFFDFRLLPFGVYYIITENEERYILMYTGRFDGNYRRERTVARAADNMPLYNRLMSYSIENIINVDAFMDVRDDIACFEVSGGMREYSTLDFGDYSDIFLRELNSVPAAYRMKYTFEAENLRREIRALFSYKDSDIVTEVPLRDDWR